MFTALRAVAVNAPYSDNFDSYLDGSAPNNFSTFTTGGGVFFQSQWSIQNPSGTSGVYRDDEGGDFVKSSAAVNVTNLANSDFLLSTNFVINSFSAPSFADIRVGLGALGSSSDFSTTGYHLSYEVLENGASGTANGALEIGEGQFFLATSVPLTTLPVTLGTTYTMTLMGNYSPSGLTLTGTLTNGSNSISLTTTDPTPSQGSYFGYYDPASGAVNQAASLSVSYDNFSISVPEPGIISLLGIGIGLIGICNISRRKIQRALAPVAARKVTTRRSSAAREIASGSNAWGRFTLLSSSCAWLVRRFLWRLDWRIGRCRS